jgi:hypothetical protein
LQRFIALVPVCLGQTLSMPVPSPPLSEEERVRVRRFL